MDYQVSQILSRLAAVLERLESHLDTGRSDTLTLEEACELLKVSRSTLERRMKGWVKGAHYWREGRLLRFDRELLVDWQRNRNDEAAHQRAIDARLKKLPSNRKR